MHDEQKFIYYVNRLEQWKSLLARPRGNNPRINRRVMWKRLTNYTEEERKTRLKTYFKFMFVREPWKFPPIHKSTSTAQVVDYSVPKSRLMLSKELENCTAVTLKCLATNTFAPLKNFWIREKRTRWTSYKSTRTEILDFWVSLRVLTFKSARCIVGTIRTVTDKYCNIEKQQTSSVLSDFNSG